MRFVYVILLAACQLTAVPFVGLLTANTIRQDVSSCKPQKQNMSIVYKTHDGSAPAVIQREG